MAAPLLNHPLCISKRHLRLLAETRKTLENEWRELALAESLLRKREILLTQLEAQLDVEERDMRDSIAAGAEIVE